MEFIGIPGGGNPPIPDSRHKDPGHPSNWTPSRDLVPVEWGAPQKDQHRNGQPHSGKAITKGPSHIVLYVHKEGVGKEGAKEDTKHPPVEEGELLGPFPWLKIIKLVSSHGGDVGLGPSSACCNNVQGTEKDAHLKMGRLFAVVGVVFVAFRRPERRQGHGKRQ